MKSSKILMVFIFLLILSSCGKVINPYDDSFQCKNTYNGKCVGMDEAYEESINPLLLNDKKNLILKKNTYKEEFQKDKYNKLQKLINDDKAPLLVPAKVKRALILPYSDKKNGIFNSHRYIYIILDKERWLLSPNSEDNRKD